MSVFSKLDVPILRRVLMAMACLLILKVTGSVVLGYRDYIPPSFESEFLLGRERYFWQGYHWSFYLHIASGPGAIIAGLILVSDRFRLRFPKWHRYIGRMHVLNTIFVVAPSGLWMAQYALAGPIACVGFSVLAVLTGLFTALGWRSAVQRRFVEHRRWMWRSFLLLCSAVVLRVLGGAATVCGVQSEWFDPLASWFSWSAPLLVYELRNLVQRRITIRRQAPGALATGITS